MIKRTKLLICAVVAVLLSCLICGTVTTALAYDGFTETTLSSQDLFTQTNTFACTSVETISDPDYIDHTQYNVTYDLDNRLENVSVMDTTQITVLTHGLASDASNWSGIKANSDDKNLSFYYDPTSLIWEISEAAGGANVYWAKMNSDLKDFTLYDLVHPKDGLSAVPIVYEKNILNLKIVDRITDISKHIIIVFESYNPYASNANVYYEFNHMLSRIIYDVKYLNGGILPKVNLIGHSRGGLTNLQYALDHPDIVSSLISLDTPYFGSTTAQLFGESFMGGPSDGLTDILNPEIYFGYNNQWNNNYNELYSNINAVAIGSYTSLLFWTEIVAYDQSGVTDGKELLIYALLGAITTYKLSFSIYRPLVSIAAGYISEIFDLTAPSTTGESIMEIFFQEINFDIHPPFLSWFNDALVPLDSQLASSGGSIQYGGGRYKGFKRKNRFFNINDGTDFTKIAQNLPPVAHNLVTRDKRIINSVLGELELGVSKLSAFSTIDNTNGTTTIFGYIGDMTQSTFFIPESINGKTVTAISPYAFADNFNGNDIVTKVSIPATVKEIGSGAFAKCTNLTQVIFEGTSQLEVLGSGAFAGCTGLTSIPIPVSTKEIYDGAFAHSGISEFTVTKNVTMIDGTSFAGCENLEKINVAATNQFYQQIDGVLYNKGASVLICYPINYRKNNIAPAEFSVPVSVTEIAKSAFAGNLALTSVSLNNVLSVQSGAFFDCANISSITAPNLNFAALESFAGTDWLNSQSEADIISIGDVLLLYQGTESVVDLSGYQSVGDYAFADNQTLEYVKTGNDMITLGSFTFYGCDNLETVLLENPNRSISIGEQVFYQETTTPCSILVPLPLYQEYQEDSYWQQYSEQISVPQTTVILNTQGGNTLDNISVSYYDYFNLPTPTKTGYDFVGWYDSATDGTQYTSATLWTQADDSLTLYARWQAATYTAALYTDGGTGVPSAISFTVQDNITLPAPAKTGHTFDGWYDNADFTGSAYTEIASGTATNLNLYAKWTPKQYTVTLKTDDPDQPDDIIATVTYDSHFTFPVPEDREGNVFNGWKYNDTVITLASGETLQPWNIDENVELTASWTLKRYYIKVNANGSVSWLTPQGFQNNQSPIEYGAPFMNNQELENAFNPDKISMKAGHRFQYFSLEENGERFLFWQSTIPDLGADGTILEIYAVFIPETNFSIVYNQEIAQPGINPLVAGYGAPISLMSKSKYGYIFRGWFVAENELNNEFIGTDFAPGTLFNYTAMPDLSVGVEQDGTHIYLDAKFDPVLTTISYVPYNGTTLPSRANVAYGERISLPVITKAGYIFKGWFSAANGTGTQYGDAQGNMLRDWDKISDTVLYAHWEIITYTINYYPNGGTHSGSPANYNVTSNVTLSDATREGYRFMGWYTNSSFTGSRVYSIPTGSTGTKYFYAKWSKLYTLAFSSAGGTSCASISGIAGDIITLPTSVRGGYKGRWATIGKDFGATYTITTATDSSSSSTYTIYATWTEKNITECFNDVTGRYEIYTYNQLNGIRDLKEIDGSSYPQYVTYCYYDDFELMDDITIPGYWTPFPYTFKGSFYGNFHTISHLYINVGTSGEYGLFSTVYGSVEDLYISDIYIYGSNANTDSEAYLNVGAVAGYASNGSIRKCRISNGSIQVKSYLNTWVGGICGFNGNGMVYQCDNYSVTVTGSGDVGGIVGSNGINAVVDGCINFAQTNYQYMTGNGNAGCIVGRNGTAANVRNCTNYGLIKYDSPASNNTDLAPCMGQIIGYNYDRGTYSSNVCSGTYDYSNLKTKVGGFLGIGAKNQQRFCSYTECGLDEA